MMMRGTRAALAVAVAVALTLLSAAVVARAQGLGGPVKPQVTPAAPTSQQVVKVTANFGATSGCGYKMKVARRKVKGKTGPTTIRIWREGEGQCDAYFEAGPETVSLGKLAAGRYLIEVGDLRADVTVKAAK
ncbi:MAG: hypothetical protein IT370_28565 [Deltaproteobacteria bacterium]|nr:hypothetical protein [Deltaproteobacteria bacterium]